MNCVFCGYLTLCNRGDTECLPDAGAQNWCAAALFSIMEKRPCPQCRERPGNRPLSFEAVAELGMNFPFSLGL